MKKNSTRVSRCL